MLFIDNGGNRSEGCCTSSTSKKNSERDRLAQTIVVSVLSPLFGTKSVPLSVALRKLVVEPTAYPISLHLVGFSLQAR